MTPYEKGLCEAARLDERQKIAAKLVIDAAAHRKNGEGHGAANYHLLVAECTEVIAEQIRKGIA